MYPSRLHLARACRALLLSLLALGTAQAADPAPNRVLQLDGDGDYVQLPGQIFDDLEQATIEAWVKWDSFGWNDAWFTYGSLQLFAINNMRTNLAFELYDRQQEMHRIEALSHLPPGRWIHMAAVSGPGGMRLYINGFEVGRDDFAGSFATLRTNDPVALGHSSWSANMDFMGAIDEVRVWRTRRSAAQIRADLHRRLRGDEAGLAALWNFDGACAAGEVVDDDSGHGHQGRLVGDAHCPEVELPERLVQPLTLRGQITAEGGDPVGGHPVVQLFKGGEEQPVFLPGQALWGNFQFWVFEPGPFAVRAASGDRGAWREGIIAAPGDRAQAIELALRPATSLQGRVLHLDATPLRHIGVEAVAPDGRVEQRVETDAEGAFRFVQLRPGEYAVRMSLPDRYVYAGAEGIVPAATDAAIFRVAQGRTATVPALRLAPIRQGAFRVYGAFEGLKANAITDIAPAPDGRLWLASAGTGVWTFDGQTFNSLTAADGLPHDEVYDVEVTADGAVWLATKEGAARYKDGRLTTLTTADGLPHDVVTALHQTPDGVLWLATSGGVVRKVGDDFEPIASINGALRGFPVRQIRTGRDGALWLATEYWSVWRYRDGELEHFHTRHGLASPRVYSVLEDRDGRLWAGTRWGLSRADEAPLNPATSRFDFYNLSSNIDHYTDLYQTGDGTLWFATRGKGVLRSDGERLVRFTTADGLAHDEVTAMGEDFQGGLWFGSADGRLTRYEAHNAVNYSSADGLGAGQVNAVVQAPQGPLWLASGQGVWRFEDDVFKTLALPNAEMLVTSLALREGALWFGIDQGMGVWRYEGGAAREMKTQRTVIPWRAWIKDLHVADDGRVWAATPGGALYMNGDVPELADDDYGAVSEVDGLPASGVTAVEGADGVLYFGTEDGLVLYDGEQLSFRKTADGLVSDRVTALRTDPEGDLWVGTGGGLSRYDGSSFVSYTERDGLPHSRVEDIATDVHGRHWIATYGGGLAVFDGAHWSAVDTRDGLGDDRVNALTIDEDGSVWLGTERGLTRYRPDSVPPRVRIIAAQTDSLYRAPERLPAFATDTHLIIDYGAVDFKTHAAKRQYRHRLVGRDDDWRTTGSGRFEWTPDEPGEYVFEVQAIDRDLNYSESARLPFRVVPVWYENAWIVGPLGLGVLLSFVVAIVSSGRYYRSRRQNLALREQMLDQERAAREQLEKSNAELSKSYELTLQAQQQAEQAAEAAEAANQAKSAFLANMSHELRTPLNAILGFSQLLHRSSDNPEQQETLGIVQRSGEHLLALINDVLEMSRIEAGHTELEEQAFDLRELLDSLAAMFRLRAEGKGLYLHCAYGEGMPRYVRADEGKLRQILINLLGNAVKFTADGGIEMRAEMVDGRLQVAVADTGPGIGAEEQATLFDAFVQTQSGRQAHTGTGLGLTISQQFAQLMGGEIAVQSEAGQGSTFRLEIPIALADAAEVVAREAPRRVVGLADGQPEWRVLVVDDGEDNRVLLQQVLAPLGFALREAVDGREAIEVWRAWQPQLILMDMRMPVMDGYEATAAIKDEAGEGAPVIVALTASAFEEQRQEVLAAGCDDFVRKPFKADDLLARIAEHLGAVYRYAEERDAPAAEPLSAGDMASMPEAWRRALAEAARIADEVTLQELIAEIEADQPELAAQVRRLVDDFAFDEIIALAE